MQHHTPSHIHTCSSRDEAWHMAMALPPEERASLGSAHFPFLTEGEPALLLPLTDMQEGASQTDVMASHATAEDAARVYEALFIRIAEELIRARKEGRPLSLHIGEGHTDRGAAAIELMVIDIAKRLGITHMGFEAHQEETHIITGHGKKISSVAFDQWPAFLQSLPHPDGKAPETDAQHNPLRNKVYLIPAIMADKGFTLFPTDKITSMDTASAIFTEREAHMLATIQEKAGQENAVLFCGATHLYGLEKLATAERRIFSINTAQNLLIRPHTERNEQDPELALRRTPTAYRPRFCTGRVHSFDEAQTLANHASRSVGDRLERTFTPLLNAASAGTLTAIDLGGRTRTEPERQRA